MRGSHPMRDGRSTDTRERILRVAEQLYDVGGYEAINLQAIADQVGVSKTALFHHFRNKQDLFFSTLLHILRRYHDLFSEAVAQEGLNVRQRLRHIMLGLTQQAPFDMMRYSREEHDLLSAEQQSEVERAWRASLFDSVYRLLSDGVERGELRQMDVTLSTFVFMHLCMLLPRAGTPPAPDAPSRSDTENERVIDALLDLYLSGVGQPPA